MLNSDPPDEHFEFESEQALPLGVQVCFAGRKTLNDAGMELRAEPGGLSVVAAVYGGCSLLMSGGARIPLRAGQALLSGRALKATPRPGAHGPRILYALVKGHPFDLDELPPLEQPFDAPDVLERLGGLVGDSRRNAANRYRRAASGFAILMDCCAAKDSPPGHELPELVLAALGIIEEEYPYVFGVEEIAQRLEVSKHHLIRVFTRATGISPGRALASARIGHAEALLRDTDYSVEIVGQMVGYSGGNYFSKAFKSHTGMSPGQYRAAARR